MLLAPLSRLRLCIPGLHVDEHRPDRLIIARPQRRGGRSRQGIPRTVRTRQQRVSHAQLRLSRSLRIFLHFSVQTHLHPAEDTDPFLRTLKCAGGHPIAQTPGEEQHK